MNDQSIAVFLSIVFLSMFLIGFVIDLYRKIRERSKNNYLEEVNRAADEIVIRYAKTRTKLNDDARKAYETILEELLRVDQEDEDAPEPAYKED